MSSDRPIADRILDCFPGGTYALTALLRLLDVVETEDVPTAAVECRGRPRLLINPTFVAQHADTPEKLLMLVMHELHHVLLGHTRLFPRMTAVDNLVFDAIINSLLCRMFPEPVYTSLFTSYYPDTRVPECLLRPPEGWNPKEKAAVPPALQGDKNAVLRQVYRALYSPTGATYEDLYDVLRQLISEEQAASVPLLGDHRPEEKEAKSGAGTTAEEKPSDEESPLVFDVVKDLAERWPATPDPVAGRSLGGLLKMVRVQHRPISNRTRLRALLRRVADLEREFGTVRAWRDETTAILSPLPTTDRRSTVLRALGTEPLLHQAALPRRQRRPTGEKVHVYVDVSGSIGNLKSALYGAVLDCRDYVYPAIHLFSTEVVDVSLAQLRAGFCKTTGGTDINCVAAHMLAKKVRRAVLLTDGWVGRPQSHHLEVMRQARLGVALTPGNSSRADLLDLTDYWESLEIVL